MMDMAHQLGFCLPQSPQGRRRAHSKPIEKPVVQPVDEQKLEDPQVSEELGTKVTVTGGRRAGEILISLPGWRSELAINSGYGRTQALRLPASCLSHHDTFSAKAATFRAKAGPATRTHGQVPIYTPECCGAP